jgi:hypothetical protein
MVEALRPGIQTHLNVAETFPAGQLGEGQAEELFAAGEMSDLIVALIAADAAREKLPVDQLDELGEHEPPGTCHPKVEPLQGKRAPPT